MHKRGPSRRALLGAMLGLPATSGAMTLDEAIRLFVPAKPPEREPCGDRPLRVALVVGHNKRNQGANGHKELGCPEWTFWERHAGEFVDACALHGIQTGVFQRESGLSYSREIDKCYKKVRDELDPDLALELHFNWAKSSSTMGTWVVHRPGGEHRKWADICQKSMEDTLSEADPWRKTRPGTRLLARSSGRGTRSLFALSVPVLILEPTFAATSGRDAWLLSAFADKLLYDLARDISLAAGNSSGA